MSCACKKTAHVPNVAGQLIFSFKNKILIDNFCNYLEQKSLKYILAKETVVLETQSLSQTLCDLLYDKKPLLNSEKEAIQVLILEEGEVLDFETMTRTRSLQQYHDLFESDFLLDVLDDGSMTTHFQPIIDLKAQKIFGYECLIRGVEEKGDLIPAGKLFDAARRSGLTFNLDRQARETALKTGAVKKIDDHLFINFLPTTIYNPETCLQDTFKWAQSLEYDYSKLVFEVVETEKVEDFDHLAHILSYYRKQGVKTALDDVGAGFSNLNALIRLKPDIIKIDREIIDGIHTDSLKKSIFEALVKISKENGITVLAEGIELREEFDFVRKNGADLAQGYFMGKPNVEPIRALDYGIF